MLAYHPLRDPDRYTEVDKAFKEACCSAGPTLCKDYYQMAILSNGAGYTAPSGGIIITPIEIIIIE